MLYLASILLVLIGIIHSYMGEKYILIRLFKRDDLPKLRGSDWFTKRAMRFAWHLTSIAWWGFSAVLMTIALPSSNVEKTVLLITAIVFAVSGLSSVIITHGKHRSWIFFFLISGLSFYAAYGG